jgi:hypothetical protein
MMVDKHARLYVGAGSKQGVSSTGLTEQVVNACGVESGDVQRVSVRGSYSFIDVSEKVADQVVERLADAKAGSGDKLFVKRAVTLSIPRDPTPEELSAMQQQSEESYGGGEREGNGHRHYDEGEGDEGPTMLAVDDQA